MKIFKLPDLGEGLPDAQIRTWYVKVGDDVVVDQPLAAMETAKALVDVPAPFSGRVEKLFGEVGDTIETEQPLIGFEGEALPETHKKDAGTVVGVIEESGIVLEAASTILTSTPPSQTRIKATPAVRQLAKQLGVDLEHLTPAQGDVITIADVKNAVQHTAPSTTTVHSTALDADWHPLSQARRAMVLSMTASHRDIVPVTLVDDADLHMIAKNIDLTVRMLRAIQAAVSVEPILNAAFDGQKMAYRLNTELNIGLAIDTPHGLFVPVLKDIANQSDEALRACINRYKQQAHDKSLPPDALHGATFMLSNFGALAGRYATPILVPPLTAILGVGALRDTVVAFQGQPAVHPVLPLSLTIDHRAVTGGEAARFLRTVIQTLEN